MPSVIRTGRWRGVGLRGSITVSLLCAAGPGAAQQVSPAGAPRATTPAPGPLRPARTVAFETSAGTWMSLDVSPDGRTLVFDLLGDLYTVAVSGGRATPLTRGPAVERRPVWSPDGRQIAYLSDASGAERLWVMAADGTAPRPIAPERPVVRDPTVDPFFTGAEWTPDGRYVVSDDTLYRADGGEPPRALGLEAKIARFSPEGRYVYFIRRGDSVVGQRGLFYPAQGGLRRYDRLTGDTLELAPDLTREHALHQREPVVSPDGQWLAYVSTRDSALWVRQLATGAERRLAQPVFQAPPLFVKDGRYVFTPDSRAVLLSYGGQLHRIDVATGADALIPFTAPVRATLAPLLWHQHRVRNGPVPVRGLRSPALSPDGRRLVFGALQRLYTMALPRGTPRPLLAEAAAAAQGGQFQPAYSPDGRWLAYVTSAPGVGGHVWRVPATGGTPERLTQEAGHYRQPAWAPDGATLAVLNGADARPPESRDNGPSALALLPSTGGPLQPVVADAWRLGAVTFSQDGQRLFFLTRQPAGDDGRETIELHAVRRDGGDRQVLARIRRLRASSPGTPAVIVPSPDGRYVAFSSYQQLYLAPLAGRPAPVTLEEAEAEAVALMYGARDVRWSADGRALTWVVANQVVRLDPARALAGAARAARGGRGAQGPQEAQGPPYRLAPPAKAARVIPVALRVPRHRARGTLALRGARVITMRGDEVLEPATVVITDDRLVAVGPMAAVRIPAGATVLDVPGTTIIPGLVDLHWHAGPGRDLTVAPEDRNYLATLAYGVTTVRNASGPLTAFDDAELIEAGRLLGPRLFHAGPSILGGHVRLESLADARVVVQHRKRMGAVVVKQYEVRTRRQRQWVYRAAAEAGLNVMAHGYLDVILDGVTGAEHAILEPEPYEDMLRLRAASKTWHTPTLTGGGAGCLSGTGLPEAKPRRFGMALGSVRLAVGAERRLMSPDLERRAHDTAELLHRGGHVTVGSHAVGAAMQCELAVMQQGGLSPHAALRAATLQGAAGLGLERDLGSLEAGKLADLVVLEANPLEDILHTLRIRYVMKNGLLYDGDTLEPRWPAMPAMPARRAQAGHSPAVPGR